MMQTHQLSIAYGQPDLFLKIGPALIAGFILSDESYVLRIRDIQKALGFDTKSENRLPELLQSISRFAAVPPAITDAFENPLLLAYPAPDGQKIILRTIPADLALLFLETIVSAKNNGFLNVGQLKTAKAAAQLLGIFEKKNIYNLIDEGSGLDFYKSTTRTRIQQLLASKYDYIGFEWIKILPDAYFELLFAIYETNWKLAAENPEYLSLVVHDTIFSRLESPDIDTIGSEKPKRQYKSAKNKKILHQIIETRLNALFEFAAAAANNRNIFLQLLNRTHPKNNAWPVKDTDFQNEQKAAPLSGFNLILKKGISIPKN